MASNKICDEDWKCSESRCGGSNGFKASLKGADLTYDKDLFSARKESKRFYNH